VTLAFFCEVVYEKYENLSIFVKITAKKISGTFYVDTVYRSITPWLEI